MPENQDGVLFHSQSQKLKRAIRNTVLDLDATKDALEAVRGQPAEARLHLEQLAKGVSDRKFDFLKMNREAVFNQALGALLKYQPKPQMIPAELPSCRFPRH